MVSFTQLEIAGHDDLEVPNTFIRQESDSQHLALFLPGRGYRASMPALYYPQLLLVDRGADALLVEYAYDRGPALRGGDMRRMLSWLYADVEAALRVGLSQRAYRRLTLVGKSLGTYAMLNLLSRRGLLPSWVDWIWLTPILSDAKACNLIAQARPRSFFAAGEADAYYDADALTGLLAATAGESLVIPGADHSLEIPGDLQGTLAAMGALMQALERFLFA